MRYFPLASFLLASISILSVDAAEVIDYTESIAPIFQKHCEGCHSADEGEGGFSLHSFDALMEGGDGGAAITAGASGSSRLYLMAARELEPVMPPAEEPGLSEKELELLSAWIDQGAKGPSGETPIRRSLSVPKIRSGEHVKLPITALAISADGTRHAVARFGTVQIVDENEQLISEIADLPGKVNSVSFSRDGTRVLVASGLTGSYGRAGLYDVETAKLHTEMLGHNDVLYSAVFSPDEAIIATAGYDRIIKLWDASSGDPLRDLKGHNGAIFDLAFSPDGKLLVSGCADETAKVWNVATGKRLDTLGQPEGEVFAVQVTPDGKYILAGSADNRVRVWRLRSTDRPRINPIVATRFVDESPIVNFAMSPDGNRLAVLSEAGNVKLLESRRWTQVAVLEPLKESASDLVFTPDSSSLLFSLMNGRLVTRKLPKRLRSNEETQADVKQIYLDLGEPTEMMEPKGPSSAINPTKVPRNVKVSGVIAKTNEFDHYQWKANAGEVWAIDVNPTDGSMIDPIVSILDDHGQPVLRTRLQAVRDTYFTFRGKNSSQFNDFRLFNWQEIHLNDYLYANGEVTRTFMHPRGPDSGFNMYPNEGNRWTYFGTSHVSHALGEPAYVVRPIRQGDQPAANGLPVFNIVYENDDDPMRLAGISSRLVFVTPRDAVYTARVADTRGEGGSSYEYELLLRAAAPSYSATLGPFNRTLHRGAGREVLLRVDRIDEFMGKVTFTIDDLPEGIHSNFPVVVEEGQRFAIGNVWADQDAPQWNGVLNPRINASATINERRVEREAGKLGELSLDDRGKVIPRILPIDFEGDGLKKDAAIWTLNIPRGETRSARVVVDREKGFDKEIQFGKETAGRNTAFGVYVDNIGLNGLLIRQNESDREFFLTADPACNLGSRLMFLKTNVDGGLTTPPIRVEVTE